MKTTFYKIKALTNIQPGSGEATFGVVDNLVQFDPATDIPTIHGSSLKGALREFMNGKLDDKTQVKDIFGNPEKGQGDYRFLSAQLIAIPMRSNKKMYYMATSPQVLSEFLELAKSLGVQLNQNLKTDLEKLAKESVQKNKPKVMGDKDGLYVEDFEDFETFGIELNAKTKEFLGITDDNLILLNHEDFKNLVSADNLPVIARNQLDKGESQNLWYEQVLPRFTVFVMPLIHTDEHFEDFNKKLTKEGPVHIGANASVGYGFTQFIHNLIEDKSNDNSNS